MLAIGGAPLLLAWLGGLKGLPSIRMFWQEGRLPILVIGGFLALALGSIIGTATPGFHAWRLLEFALPVIVTVLMISLGRAIGLPVSSGVIALGLTVTALLVLVEQNNGSPLRAYFGLRDESWRLNRTVVTLLFLMLAAFAVIRRDRGQASRYLVLLLPLLVILRSDSGAANLGLLVAGMTLVFAYFSWRFALNVSLFVAVAILLTAPWQGIILWDIIPDALHQQLRSTSSAIRVDIWRAFGWAVQHEPFFGSGFNTAAHLAQEPAYAAIPEKLRNFIEFGHAHNAALQIWVELGLVGAVGAVALTVFTLKRIDRAAPILRPAMLAAFNAAVSIAVVSHGAWQAWWAGVLGLTVLLMVSLQRSMIPSRNCAPD